MLRNQLLSLAMSNDEALSHEQVDAQVRRARDLIAHPEHIGAAGKDEIEGLLRALVGLADTFLGRPVTTPKGCATIRTCTTGCSSNCAASMTRKAN